MSNLIDQGRIPVGIMQSLWHLRRFKPDVVLATGGYVAVPPVLAAAFWRVPILIHEQTAQVGLANRINARFATKIALSWDESLKSLTPKLRAKAFVSGNPVRPSIWGGAATRAESYLGLSEETLPVVYVTGGSLGARVINRAVEEVLPQLLEIARVVHQCGEQPNDPDPDFARLTRARLMLPEHLQKRYALTRFIRDELKDVFALTDLVVGRAGAGTVTELCALGKPALYVPLVPTGGDEQTKNAQMAVQEGAAKILKQSECRGATLLQTVRDLLRDRKKLREMGDQATHLAKPGAAREIAKAVLELAGK
jgi:UDP-N-acetylglucosamine--N-acetylmuramyl-(pentapeptide) pyrophosphoryl-undecaprenol N-acetylglucosamine transferase